MRKTTLLTNTIRWIIDPPLDITVPAKRTPWPDAPPELPSDEKASVVQEHREMQQMSKTGRPSRPRHGSRNKRKHETRRVDSTLGSVKREEN
ncbi:hypothetical protein GIB67_023464 [Kingdonia uniflora]|uniref:Uncharacterized protein n=1 Tax=Kingdonia uniflora TaxID=39325 RepID=A0A7J7P9Z6_9MAGN|nr:hypothetical protein GIB67_023464 [Kingdonia uniflora]